MKLLSWEEVLLDPAFARGEIQMRDNAVTSRGPLESIQVRGDDIYFMLLWPAVFDYSAQEWVAGEYQTVMILKMSATTVRLNDEGEWILEGGEIIEGKIVPEGGDWLDPSLVRGLDPAKPPGPCIVDMDPPYGDN